MKAVDLLINSVLPKPLQAEGRVYDSKTVAKLLAEVARDYPDDYGRVVKGISDIGRTATWSQGESIGLDDLEVNIDKAPLYANMEKELHKIETSKMTEKDKREARLEIWTRHATELEKLTKDSVDPKTNALGASVLSGARGKLPQLQAMVAAPGVYTDFFGNIVPLFARNSFAEGVRPGHFLAATYGARASVVSTKVATAKGGDLCLAAGTMVRMADRSIKAIEKIKVGEWVLGADRYGKCKPARVTCFFEQGVKEVYAYAADGYGDIKCTPAHKFLTEDGSIIPATDCDCQRKKVMVKMVAVTKPLVFARRTNISEKIPCFDIEVDNKDHLFVLANGVITSNSKQMIRTSTPMVVGTKDCGTNNGVDYDIDDQSLVGRVLARDTAGLKAGSLIGGKELKALQASGAKTVLCRSALTCEHDDGLCSKCCGVLPGGKYLPPVGYHMGMASATAIGEPVTQGALNCIEKSTLVRTDKGVRRIDEIQIGDTVLGADTEGNFFLTKVTDVFDQGLQPCHEYVFADGSSVRATVNHQFLTTSKDHELEVLPMGTTMACLRLRPDSLKVRGVDGPKKLVSDHFVGELHCMDIEVESPYGLFVLDNGAVCSNSKHCLAEGTLVRMANGTERRIEEIKDGEYVAGCTIRGELVPAKVRKLVNQGLQHVCDFAFDGRVIRSTSNHKVFGFGKKGPEKIKVCEARQVFGFLDDDLSWHSSTTISNPGKAQCWDISIALDSELFVLANGLVVSNTGGIYKGRREYSGFDVINRIVQSPEEFEDRAAVAETEGTISSIKPAPQGGHYITIGDHQHYVLPNYEILKKVGDKVEAGDQLSDGIVDTGDIVRLRGLGEGRRQYAERLKKALDDSGYAAHSRNVEVLARAAINHVRVDDAEGLGGYLPDDLANYDRISRSLEIPESVQQHKVGQDLVGKVLWQPALHYTVGTKLTRSMVERLTNNGFKTVAAGTSGPAFTPEMVRLRSGAAEAGDDWLVHQGTSHLKNNLVDDAVSGNDTKLRHNSNYVAPLAYGKDFGKDVTTTGKF